MHLQSVYLLELSLNYFYIKKIIKLKKMNVT